MYDYLVQRITQYTQTDFGPNVNEPDRPEASAFNILCVYEGIRSAMLFQPPEWEGTSDDQTIPNKIQKETALLAHDLEVYLNRFELYVIQDRDGFYVMRMDEREEFARLRKKTDILGLCRYQQPREIRYIFYFKKGYFIGNVCDETEGIESFAKNYVMYQGMKALARSIGEEGQVGMKVEFGMVE